MTPSAATSRARTSRWTAAWGSTRGSANDALRRGARMRLEDLLPRLPGTHAIGGLDRQHEQLAVADRPGARVLEDRVDDRLHVAVVHDALDLELGSQVVGELGAPVALGDAALATGPLDLCDRQRREALLEQLGADRL